MSEARRLSALELFHPAGSAPRVLVIGEGCPPGVIHGVTPHRNTGSADIVVVAPTVAECRAAGWLARAARTAAAALDEDGVAFLVAPARWRFRLLAAARAEGLVLGPAVLHLPDLASGRYLVTAGRSTVRYATQCVVPRNSWKGRAASLAVRLPGGTRLLALSAPASVVARRRGGGPLFEWLTQATGQPVLAERVLVGRTWRPDGGTLTLSVVDARAARPALVARVGSGPPAVRDELGEERALAAFGASAEAAGAAVPHRLASSRLHGVPLLIETGVPGRVAASLLAEHPREVPAVLDRVLAWLLRWNRGTAAQATLTPELIEREVLTPARLVTPAVPAGDTYLRLLEHLCGEVAGGQVPLTLAHDDLTMTNVLLQGESGLGVVDWDTARSDALPLVDFFYTVVDAYAASEAYSDRPRAFAQCFSDGPHARAVAVRRSRFERALGVTSPVVQLSFHACWLHHAANELHRGEVDGPFVAILRRIVADFELFSPAAGPDASRLP